MNIFEALRQDHDIQRKLLDKLVDTSGDTAQRDSIFKELKKELESHADAEERYFYKPLIDSDKTQEKARHSIAEHHEIDELIERLEETEYSSSAWLKIAKELQEKVEHHLDEEEHEVFQIAGKVLSETNKESLAKAYERHMEKER
ncbi:hemerythrin domain-containing protein [Pseudozobellia thermophila]|uniref:Hemerythrin HHE cation binding domain-containing protein n=1 Tax=Pseudozobellia thermophila TaxID=192903 RepID=A0A1M6M899_9FLAO|nr:hemerythrin domain-containing protein [Pseudozobellia thermophila]SHJ79697.1 Hemerythrin HHE cation binding domain-containing protein [Pseudozobellia thermophila]